MTAIRTYALAGLATAALVLGTSGSALAAGGGHHGGGGHHYGGGGHYYGHRGGWGWGGLGAGLIGGLALGAATAPYWGGYGYYTPYYDDYGPECYIRRRIIIRHGVEHIRRVRVCY
jgi:hypothetical protein